jgi:hypothetical protein
MPSRDATGKRFSGARNKQKQREAQRELQGAPGAPAELIGAPTEAAQKPPGAPGAPGSRKGALPQGPGAPDASQGPSWVAEQVRAQVGVDAPSGAWPDLPTDVRAQFTPPPKDPIDLQVWGAQTVALLAWIGITRPGLLPKEQHNLIRNHLATMGLLFPRSEYVRRLQKIKADRKTGQAESELKPLEGLDPGPTRRARAAR